MTLKNSNFLVNMAKRDITIIHHLGFGDHVMLNGMARYLSEFFKVHVVVTRAQVETVSFMYRDTDIQVLATPTKNAMDVRRTAVGGLVSLATYAISDGDWKTLTFSGDITTWAHLPYAQAGVNPDYMRRKFHVVRDPIREKALFDSLGLKDGEEYVFEHRDPINKDFGINRTSVKIINPDNASQPYNAFDWLLVIEKAREVHCANSGPYAWMIELLRLGGPHKNFFHVYAAHQEYSPKCVQLVFSSDIWTFIGNSSPPQ